MGIGSPRLRLLHAVLAISGAAGAWGVLSLDTAHWVQWLTSGGEITSSRRERVEIARALLAAGAATVAALGLAGAVAPQQLARGYARVGEQAAAAFAGRRAARDSLPAFALSALSLAVLLGAALAVHRATGTPLEALTRDPASVLDAPAWIGLLSNLGLLLWSAAAAVSFLGASASRERGADPTASFLTASGALTTLLLLDDMLQLHEGLLPRFTGLPEMVFVCAYPLAFALWALRYGALILAADWPLLGASAALLAVSMGLDIAIAGRRLVVLEDTAKLAGIVLWLAFHARVARRTLTASSA